MSFSGYKDMALTAMKLAVALFPPLAELIADALHALDPAQSSGDPLVKQVRSILPERSASEQAARDLSALADKALTDPSTSIADSPVALDTDHSREDFAGVPDPDLDVVITDDPNDDSAS